MKNIMFFILALFIIFASAYTAQAIHETIPAETQIAEPGADALKLYDYITIYKPYSKWQLFPGKGMMYKGTQPHGAFLITYVNDAAYSSIKGKKGFADGSMIVKENYTEDKKLDSLTVMYKISGFNPQGGDWFWTKYGADGKTVASGRVEVCLKCHETKKDNDYIFSGVIK